ncbi:tRNA (guanine-N1-)-methyltransferase [Pyrobaculum neutrophilum V24Sta]|uniref:tRNA (Guanine-N1-)-methyltransferase n=1 Tax=Pyrobaculum neutrophilum (strain DSM 2338 / JCM 9278 / NBRC 100436 / V24Sta) TaxID=444157 RepID=B1YDL9_PYRNV|nr:tRNA (guanine-N1-)-methyltransferase [Pyrobaculum neutrophilum V24Sta]
MLAPLWRSFFRFLAERGVDSLCLPPHFRCWGDVPQCVAVGVLVGRYAVCRGERRGGRLGMWEGVEVLGGRGAGVCRWVLARRCAGGRLEVDFSPPERPRIVVDLSLWGEHTPGEKHELVEQILATLGAVRRVLWDGNLWVTNAPGEFLELLGLHARGLVHRMNISGGPPPLEKPVVLDPEGDCLFTEEAARSHWEFIIGGIVDKERTAKSGTRRLAELLGVEKRCRIELRGSLVGVPDRINKIAEIVLSALAGVPLEEAILRAQAKRDRVYRLMWEIQRRALRLPDGRLAITRDALAEANWLGAPPGEVELALRKTHAVVLG